MRKLTAAVLVAGAAFVAGPALAADFPEYPPIIEIPDVDYGYEGSFYLRGSAAGNAWWAHEGKGYACAAPCGGGFVDLVDPVTAWGYGYSIGAGVGYETGTGLRVDATIDFVKNTGLTVTKGATAPFPGDFKASLRSTIALANIYYDFYFDQGYGAVGGVFGYAGAGAGVAFNHLSVTGPAGSITPDGQNVSLAAAGMVGVGYDFGALVADLGYRAVYINQISNSAAGTSAAWADNNWLHEVRGTLRYRFN